MRFVTVRDLRSKPGQIWQVLSKEKEMVLTSNGKPIAILSATSGHTLEESLAAIRRARATTAVTYMQTHSVRMGADRMSLAKINKEVAAERKHRSR